MKKKKKKKKVINVLIVFFIYHKSDVKTFIKWILNQCHTTLVNMTLYYKGRYSHLLHRFGHFSTYMLQKHFIGNYKNLLRTKEGNL